MEQVAPGQLWVGGDFRNGMHRPRGHIGFAENLHLFRHGTLGKHLGQHCLHMMEKAGIVGPAAPFGPAIKIGLPITSAMRPACSGVQTGKGHDRQVLIRARMNLPGQEVVARPVRKQTKGSELGYEPFSSWTQKPTLSSP